MICYESKACGSISAAKARFTSTRLKSAAEAGQNYIAKILWSNNDLHLHKGSFLAKKLSHMPADRLLWK
jgi:hypothetical protein